MPRKMIIQSEDGTEYQIYQLVRNQQFDGEHPNDIQWMSYPDRGEGECIAYGGFETLQKVAQAFLYNRYGTVPSTKLDLKYGFNKVTHPASEDISRDWNKPDFYIIPVDWDDSIGIIF